MYRPVAGCSPSLSCLLSKVLPRRAAWRNHPGLFLCLPRLEHINPWPLPVVFPFFFLYYPPCYPNSFMICLSRCFRFSVSYFSFLLFCSGSCLLLARVSSWVLGLSPLSMLDWQPTDAIVPLPSGRSIVGVSVVRVVIL